MSRPATSFRNAEPRVEVNPQRDERYVPSCAPTYGRHDKELKMPEQAMSSKQTMSTKSHEQNVEAETTEVTRRRDGQPHYQQQRPLAQPPGFQWDPK